MGLLTKLIIISYNFWEIDKWASDMVHKLLLLLDGAVYWAISQVFEIFVKLADARIFQDAFFSNFAKRIYAIIGVVMLFYLAYALLNALIDPDKAFSGDKGISKLAQNIVISLALLGLLPTIFDYAYRLQGLVFKENILGAVILGTGSAKETATLSQYGNYMAYTVLNPFLNPANYNVSLGDSYSWFDLKVDLIKNGHFTSITIMSPWCVEAKKLISDASDGKGKGTYVTPSYTPIISTICGLITLYIMASFCLDLGIRIVKFAFCQLIAPIPIIMRMVPGKKGTFDKWLKLTLTVYFEVFIRVGIMYMVVYFFSQIANSELFTFSRAVSNGGDTPIMNGVQGLLVKAIILMGLLAFAKQAPKLISDMLGLDSGNIKLGIKDKLKAGGFFAATSVAGGAALSLARNVIPGGKRFVNSWKVNKELAKESFNTHRENARNGNIFDKADENVKAAGAYGLLIGKTLFSALGVGASAIGGAASGGKNGYSAGKDSKNFGDIPKNILVAADKSEAARANRENYKASARARHPGLPNIPGLATTTAHVEDIGRDFRDALLGAAAYTLTEQEKKERERLNEFKKLVTGRDDLVKKEKAYVDAEASQRQAHVNATMANNEFNNFASAMNSQFVSEYKSQFESIINEEPSISFEEASTRAVNNAKTTVSKSLPESEQASFEKSVDTRSTEFQRLHKDKLSADAASRKADDFLKATEMEIKTQKASAIQSLDRQIETFRNNNQSLSSYIGKSSDIETETLSNGTVVTRQKVNKSLYNNRLNEFTLKEDTFRQRKQDKK